MLLVHRFSGQTILYRANQLVCSSLKFFSVDIIPQLPLALHPVLRSHRLFPAHLRMPIVYFIIHLQAWNFLH